MAALAQPAAAQTYSGQEIIVNAPQPGGGTLLYPGGQYRRTVQPLLQPGEKPRDLGAIQLHMPARHRPAPARVARTEAPSEEPVRRTPPPRPVPAPTPAPPPAQPPAQPKVARAEPAPRTTLPPPAAAEPATPGLTKRSVILFAPNATDPAASALGAIKFLATDLNTAMTGPGSRIQLQAFGGTRGDKSSDARRLSLKRALSIRQVLIDDGVPADRIDVHAGGGADDDGPADRVDVFIKA
jgi:outer membrane protein OmpA-like peptidoglycan-associated protein